jgi:hypothetical protein
VLGISEVLLLNQKLCFMESTAQVPIRHAAPVLGGAAGVGAALGTVVARVVGAGAAGAAVGAVEDALEDVVGAVVGADVAEADASGDPAVVGLPAEVLAAAGAAARGSPLGVALEQPPSATISATPDAAATAAVDPGTRLTRPFEPHVSATSTPRIPTCEAVRRPQYAAGQEASGLWALRSTAGG